MSERWSRERVLALAPDAASQRAAVTAPAKWTGLGCDARAVWGECRGSGASAYQAAVDLTGAYRCGCPSRKIPCKHVLGVLLLWAGGEVPAADDPADWVGEWLASRDARAEQAAAPVSARPAPPSPPAQRSAERREARVEAGVEEFERWLCDQVTEGLAAAETARYALWDEAARRLVDAQAGGLATQVKALAGIAGQRSADWPGLLLAEYALLHLLARAYQNRARLPEPLVQTVRSRVGFTVGQEEVLRGPTVRDHWYVAGRRDSDQERLVTRRTWLRGRATGRAALVLTFAAPGQGLDGGLPPGHTVEAELAFFPGAQPLRALPAALHGPPEPGLAPVGTGVGALLAEYAAALAADPWLAEWPAVLADVRLTADRALVDAAGDSVPLLSGDPWRLLALSGGGPVTVGGEWTPQGLRAQTAWHPGEGVITL